jgi:hypothetical protein
MKTCQKHNIQKIYISNRWVCRSCKSEYQKTWRNKNHNRLRASEKETQRYYKGKQILWYLSLFDGKSCVDCGENRKPTLDFDHVDPKTKKFSISQVAKIPGRRPEVLEEIKKCVIRCSNCHRIRTAQMNNWYDAAEMVLKNDSKSRVIKGELHSRAKLKEADILEIRKLHKNKVSYKEICLQYGIDNKTFYNIVNRKSWKHVL